MTSRTTYLAEYAWLGGDSVERHVAITVMDGLIDSVRVGGSAGTAETVVLRGLTLPGFVNTHSHVFHRALRGRTHGSRSFWGWRDEMYRVSERLDPDLMYRLARATYAEMLLAGITSVGEFHYLHHRPGGAQYRDPNEMGNAVIRAAVDVGMRITLLDTCYLQGNVDGSSLVEAQQRFSDGDWERWAERTSQLADSPKVRIGAAIHSVRAVPRRGVAFVADQAKKRSVPLHFHLSEQPQENEASMEVYGVTPTALFAGEGALGVNSTAVHATHLTPVDIQLLGDSQTSISMCSTTERDLADGPGAPKELRAAGARLCVGTDSHAMIEPLEEIRAIELNQRLITGRRVHFPPPELLRSLTEHGARSIGWDAGAIREGLAADLVSVSLNSPRTAGAASGDVLGQVVFAASSADVDSVVVGGELVVEAGVHRNVEDVGGALGEVLAII